MKKVERVLVLRMTKKLLCGIADNLKYSTDRLFEIWCTRGTQPV